jgi:DUF1680 family protein
MMDTYLPTPTAVVNGQAVRMTLDRGFARITREWRSGDVVHIYFPMPVQRLVANPKVADTQGRIALQRGPLIYALESEDNGPDLERLRIPTDADIRTVVRNDLLGGIQVLAGDGADVGGSGKPRPFIAIPYFAWANRGPSEMRVWVRQ